MPQLRLPIVPCLVLAALLAAGLPAAGAEPPLLRVGEPFPDLVLPSLAGGRARSLAEFRGERVVLHVFASW